MRNKNVFLNRNSKSDLCIFFFYHRHRHNSKIYEGKKNNVTQTREKQHQKGRNQDQSLDQALYGILSDRHSAEITQGDLHPTRSCPSFNVSLFL